MVWDRSRIKQEEISAHSSGCKGGESRVFDLPASGVLQMIETATGAIEKILSQQLPTRSANPNKDHLGFRGQLKIAEDHPGKAYLCLQSTPGVQSGFRRRRERSPVATILREPQPRSQ